MAGAYNVLFCEFSLVVYLYFCDIQSNCPIKSIPPFFVISPRNFGLFVISLLAHFTVNLQEIDCWRFLCIVLATGSSSGVWTGI